MTEYEPERGDLIWLDFEPHTGHEQAGRWPALVLSPRAYNSKTGLLICCPIIKEIKGNPFEVRVPENPDIWGVILVDQIKSLDWRVCKAKCIRPLPPEVVDDVLAKLRTIVG